MTEYEPERDKTEYLPTEWLPVGALTANDWNPNSLSEEQVHQLKMSIEDNGWTMPIVVHAEEHYIIDGEQRWSVAQHPEIAEDESLTPPGVPAGHVPVYGITVGEGQAQLATIQHNRARGDVEFDSLRNFLKDLQERSVLTDVYDRIGFTDDDAAAIIEDITSESLADETMPWEAEPEPEIVEDDASDGGDDASDDEGGADGESEDVVELPDLHESRTMALREDVDEDVLSKAETFTEALTETEYDTARRALGKEARAQSFLNIILYALDNDRLNELGVDSDSVGEIKSVFRRMDDGAA